MLRTRKTGSASAGLLLLIVIMSFAVKVTALTQALCSSQNTGVGSMHNQSNYQSNGACSTTCRGYAFGIVQYKDCWCSNTAPGDTTDVGSCNQGCPGYPDELCGNEDSGLFGYVALGKQPQRTADSGGGGGGSPSQSPTPAPNSPSPDTNTVTDVVTSVAVSVQSQAPSVSVSVSSVVIASSPSTSSNSPEPTTSTSSTSSWTPTPSASVQTVSGSVRTVVVTPSRPPQATTTVTLPDAQPDTNQGSSGGFFTNKGAVAGVFTVVGLIGAAIVGALAFLLWRRRRQSNEGSERLNSMEEDRASTGPSTFMSRRTSELGLRTDVPRVGTSDEKTPTSLHMPTPGTTSRRASMPLTDQRLNPANLFHDNGSHLSVTSLQDNQDYTRPVLQIANPDRPGSSAIED